MKNLRFIAMAGFVAFCLGVLGSQSSTFAQGRSGKSRGNSSMGETHSTDAIRRKIKHITLNHTDRNQDDHRNNDQDNDRKMGKSKNKRYRIHTNNGIRDHGRGIGHGKGQGKGRGYAKRIARHRNH